MIQAQGGDARVCEDVSLLGQASIIHPVVAPQSGYVARIDVYKRQALYDGTGPPSTASRLFRHRTPDFV